MLRPIATADDLILPMIVIGGFADLRSADITRLEFQNIDLDGDLRRTRAALCR